MWVVMCLLAEVTVHACPNSYVTYKRVDGGLGRMYHQQQHRVHGLSMHKQRGHRLRGTTKKQWHKLNSTMMN
jgi:hypothetical protein